MDPIRVGMCFDWISPLLAIARDIGNGGGSTFLIPLDCGWTGREIEKVLRSKGIQTWGLMAINDTFTITVPPRQYRWAASVLNQAGIPYS